MIQKNKKGQLNTLLKLRVFAKHIVKDLCRMYFTFQKTLVHGIKAFICIRMKTFHSLIKKTVSRIKKEKGIMIRLAFKGQV